MAVLNRQLTESMLLFNGVSCVSIGFGFRMLFLSLMAVPPLLKCLYFPMRYAVLACSDYYFS